MSSRRSCAERLTPGPSASSTAAGCCPRGWELMRRWSPRRPPYRSGRLGPARVDLPQRRLGQIPAQRDERLEHALRPGVHELALAEAAHQNADRLQPRALGRLAVPGGVADHDGLPAAGLLDRRRHEVGLRLGRLDVRRGRPAVDDAACVEQVEVVVDLVGLRRGGEHDRVPRLAQVGDQLARTLQGLHLVDQRQVERLLGRPDVVALLLVERLGDEGADQLVAPHPDVPVDAPDRQHDAMLAERAEPRERVLVVRVDERAVDVQDGGGRSHYALRACSACAPSHSSSTALAQNASRSSGLREVTRPWSTTTSSSTQRAPALRRSVWRDGHEVSVRPLTTSASISVHGAWQIAATGLACSKKPRTNATASSSIRRKSGFATPPGSTSPSYSEGSASATVRSTVKVSPLSRWLKAWISPESVESSSGEPPAASTAFQGSVSSTCSVPSGATTKATRLPCSLSDAMGIAPLGLGFPPDYPRPGVVYRPKYRG